LSLGVRLAGHMKAPFRITPTRDTTASTDRLSAIILMCLRLRRSNGSIAPWSFVDGNKNVDAIVAGPFIANDFSTMLRAALEGLGLAQVPGPIAAAAVKSGKLVQVLEPFAPMAPGVFLYYPGKRKIMPKLRAFIDHVKIPPKKPEVVLPDDTPERVGKRMRQGRPGYCLSGHDC
jgi:hypothetical protein